MNKFCYIYALYDPRAPKTIRYIGKAVNVEKRLQKHIRTAKMNFEDTTHKANWIRSLLSVDILPKSKILEKVSLKHWEIRERYWIKKLKRKNSDLTNGTDGGDGNSNPSSEIRAKISRSLFGKPLSPERCKNISLGHLGKPRSEECRKAISRGHIGLIKSILHRQHISEAQLGRKLSKEIRLKIGDSLRGRIKSKQAKLNMSKAQLKRFKENPKGPLSMEHRRKLSKAHIGKYLNAAQRLKLSKSIKEAWKIRKLKAQKLI